MPRGGQNHALTNFSSTPLYHNYFVRSYVCTVRIYVHSLYDTDTERLSLLVAFVSIVLLIIIIRRIETNIFYYYYYFSNFFREEKKNIL